jgi:hypothetical protein
MLKRFDKKHYVPILRWKEAERGALSQLADQDSICVTPLIELVPDNFVQVVDRKGHSRKLSNSSITYKVAGQLFQCWGERPFFIDLWNLPRDILSQGYTHPLVMLGEYASTSRLSLIPVTGINRDKAYGDAVRTVLKTHHQGACVRLTPDEIKPPKLNQALDDVLSFLGLTPEEVDLIIDFQVLDHPVPKLNLGNL